MTTRMDQDVMRWREREIANQANRKIAFDPGTFRKDAQQTRAQQVALLGQFINEAIRKAPDVFGPNFPDAWRCAEHLVSWVEGGSR